jgi:glycosyltransferase involved in cell wall biosynthesis
MTVVYILDSFPNLSETFILREILALKKLGINIRIYALKKPVGEPLHPEVLPLLEDVIYINNLSFKQKLFAVLSMFFRQPVLLVILAFSLFFDMFYSLRFMYHRFRGAVNAMAIANFADTKPGHIHAHFAYVTTDSARILAKLFSCKWSVSAHAWDIFTQPEKILFRRIESADKIFVCTRHGKMLLENNAIKQQDKVLLMYHGLDTMKFENYAQNTQKDIPNKNALVHIIAVGRLEEKKGFDLLLHACKILAEQNIKPHCIIVGEGPERESLEAKVREFTLDNVELIGTLAFDKVKALMAKSSMLVQPSRITKNGDHDGIPNVLLEAMALGKTVIATPVGGISELIEDGINGLLVEPENPEKLAEKIKELINDNNRAEKIEKTAKEYIKEHFEISENIKPMYEYFIK